MIHQTAFHLSQICVRRRIAEPENADIYTYVADRKITLKRTSRVLICAVWIICLVKFGSNLLQIKNIPMTPIVTILLFLIIARFCFRVQKLWLVLSVVAFVVLVSTSEYFSLQIVSHMQHAEMKHVLETAPYRLQTMAVMELIKILLIRIIARMRVGKIGKPEFVLWLPTFILPALSCLFLSSMYMEKRNFMPVSPLFVVEVFSVLAINILVFVFAEMFIRRGERDRRLAILEMQDHMQQERILQLTEYREEMRKIQHDHTHHMIDLTTMMRKGQYEEVMETLDEVTNLEAIPFFDTSNPHFDATIAAKQSQAEQEGIICNWNIKVPPHFPLLSLDICVMFGNALDNAIEACAELQSGRAIEMTIEVEQKNFLCTIRNPIDQKPIEESGGLKSRKKNAKNHGIGLKSMRSTVEKHGGRMHYIFDDTSFHLYINIPC